MIAVFKRTTIVSAIAFVVILFSSIILTSNSTAIAADNAKGKTFAAEISDIIYYAPEPAKVEFTEETPEVTPEPEPTLEETYQEDSSYEYYEEPNYNYSYDYGYTSQSSLTNDEYITAADFQQLGIIHDGVWSYTYYSENVLPGGGLEIPGRHTDEDGYICDGKGAVCVASDDLPRGTVVTLPIGENGRTGVVYDTGSGSGNLDIYTSW